MKERFLVGRLATEGLPEMVFKLVYGIKMDFEAG